MDDILFNFTISKVLNILKRRIFIIILVAMIGAAGMGGYAYTISYAEYLAKVSFYVVSNPSYLSEASVNVNSSEFSMAKNLVPSYMLILKSNTVLNKVIENLGLSYTIENIQQMISSSSVDNTSVFYVYVLCDNPYESMEIANAIAEIAPEEISRIVKSGGIEVIDYATLPTSPYNSTNLVKYVIVGFVLGFILALMISLLFGLLDTTIRNKNELEKVFTIPIIGDVPIIKSSSKSNKKSKVLNDDSLFVQREAYNTLRTNLMFMSHDEKCQIYAISSVSQGEGKSLNCINLAISFVQLGKRVLVIDADLRNPSIMTTIGMENVKQGLSQYLAGITSKINIQKANINEKLDIIDVGIIPPNPADLLSSIRFSLLLNNLSEKYDYIFIDTSPIGIVADALAFADIITGYILIVKAQDSKLADEKKIIKSIEQIDAKITGFIYNASNPKHANYKNKNRYGYGYGYEKKD